MAFVCGAPPRSLHHSQTCRPRQHLPASAVGHVPQRQGQLSAMTQETGTVLGDGLSEEKRVESGGGQGPRRPVSAAFQEGVQTSMSRGGLILSGNQ